MNPHDPYGPMLLELSDANDADTEDLFRESLRQTQPYVRDLRIAYSQSPSSVDFSCRHLRAAYLLAYYPHYIETIYHIFEDLDQDEVIQHFSKPKVRACFLGAGPAPEGLGWIAYLRDHVPEAECAIAYLLDLYVDGWRIGQEITRYHLAPIYWPNGRLITKPLIYDYRAADDEIDPFIGRTFQISDLFVMQNCLNDHLDRGDLVLENFLSIFRQASPGAIFVIADLNFDNIRNLMRRIEANVLENRIGRVLLSTEDQCAEFRSRIMYPPIIEECLLTGENRLRPKCLTRYYASVLQRVEDDDHIPF